MPPIGRFLWVAAFMAVATPAMAQRWATVWTGADQGPYPAGGSMAQPDLSAAFPKPQSGSHEQTFRMIVKPDLFGRVMRFRFSNAFGSQPVTFDSAFAGLQLSGAAVAPGTNRPITFGGKKSVTVQPGAQIWSDAVLLPFVHDPAGIDIAGRKLAISFHIPGDSGPMTWHALAMTTSYVTAPDAGAIGELEDDSPYPYSTTSWFFVDAADAVVQPGTRVVVALGDSITDGVASTLNGDDRWTDVLSRRLHAVDGTRIVVVNEGISGNRVLGAPNVAAGQPLPGGPSVPDRLDRDVLSLSGVTDVIWLEGINDLATGSTADAIYSGMKTVVGQIRAKIKGVKMFGATVITARASTVPRYGTADVDERRHALNDLIRKPGLFDGVIDFDTATVDPQTGELKPEFVPPSTFGGPGDRLHPNRPGYVAMGDAVNLEMIAPALPRPRPRPHPRPVPQDTDTGAGAGTGTGDTGAAATPPQ